VLFSTCAAGSSARLGTNLLELPGLGPSQRRENLDDEWEQVLDAVRPRYNQNYAEWQHGQVLLALKLTVHGDEHIDAAAGAPQQFAILDARPPQTLDGHDLVPNQSRDQVVG
jgi:hypothetical protein